MESIKSITDWHAATFPNANLDGQLAKLEEEKLEFMEAYGDRGMSLKELADVFIVGCGLARYGMADSLDAFNFVNSYIYRYDLSDFEKAVSDKMIINRNRTWYELPDGRHKHNE